MLHECGEFNIGNDNHSRLWLQGDVAGWRELPAMLERSASRPGRHPSPGRPAVQAAAGPKKYWVGASLRASCGPVAAHRAGGIAPQMDGVPFHAQAVEDEQPAAQPRLDACEDLHRLHGLDGADDAEQG